MKNKLFSIMLAASIGLLLIICASSCTPAKKVCFTYAGTHAKMKPHKHN